MIQFGIFVDLLNLILQLMNPLNAVFIEKQMALKGNYRVDFITKTMPIEERHTDNRNAKGLRHETQQGVSHYAMVDVEMSMSDERIRDIGALR